MKKCVQYGILSSIVEIMTKFPQHLDGPIVAAVASSGLGLFELGIAAEIFGSPRPEFKREWYRFGIVAGHDEAVDCLGGVSLSGALSLAALDEADIIIIPSWKRLQEKVPTPLRAALVRAQQRGARLVSFCSGVFALAACGILSGKRATTHWRVADTLKKMYPDIHVEPNVLYIDEGNVMTSAGSAAGIDLCLYMVRMDFGAQVASAVARRLVVPSRREGGQAQFMDPHSNPSNAEGRLAKTLEFMAENFTAKHPIRIYADHAGLTPRTFLRRFSAATGMTPFEWLLVQRLDLVRRKLESSDLSIEYLAEECGFSDAATLRHHFRSKYSTTPTAYRRHFKSEPES